MPRFNRHRSGLGEYLDQPAVINDLQRAWTPAELIAVAEAGGRVGEPGGPYHYANTNYIVLGEIIAQVTGHNWADEVRTRITEPLGMTHTSFLTTDQAPACHLVNGTFVDATHSADPSTGGAAGGLQSTGRDLLTALPDGTLLSPESWSAMQAFVPGEDLSQYGVVHSYGLGLEQYATDHITAIGHLGSGAHSAFVGYDPQQHHTAVAVQMNSDNAGPQAIMAIETLTAASQPQLKPESEPESDPRVSRTGTGNRPPSGVGEAQVAGAIRRYRALPHGMDAAFTGR